MSVAQPAEAPVAPAFWGRLALLALGLFIVGTNGFVIAGLLPAIAGGLDVLPAQVSYSITWYSISVAIAAPAITILFPRLPRTLLMVIGLVSLTAGSVISAASANLEMFTVGRVVAALGGAALVPAATAAAAALAPPEKRGRALAFVASGFTLSTALGSPLGTAIGSAFGWRVPIYGVAALSLLLALALALFLRNVPLPQVVPMRQRFAVLANPRILAGLATTLFAVAGFNALYIFSSEVTVAATGGTGALLAFLLLMYGLGGLIGNQASGFVTDKLGNRIAANAAIAAEAALLLVMLLTDSSFLAIAIVFALWGIATCAVLPPVQHRLVEVDPGRSALSLSWYTTAVYGGIGLAPIIGSSAAANPQLIPVLAAGLLLLALLAFQVSYFRRRQLVT